MIHPLRNIYSGRLCNCDTGPDALAQCDAFLGTAASQQERPVFESTDHTNKGPSSVKHL